MLLLKKRTAAAPTDTDSILHAVQDLVHFEQKMKLQAENFMEADRVLSGVGGDGEKLYFIKFNLRL